MATAKKKRRKSTTGRKRKRATKRPSPTTAPEPIKYLFRYRDLIAPTLELHREVIGSKKRCLWGWWKRPLEDDKSELWQRLKKDVQSKKKIRVGLFDSGTNQVYGAWVIGVIPPVSDPTASRVPKLSKADKALVPKYYAGHPFSWAWLRLKEIEEEPMEFFGKYSIRRIPPLAEYSKHTLQALDKKVIVDGAELRNMDTTIWEVRPRRSGDSTARVLTTTPMDAVKALSSEPIALSSGRLLHLSDLHFAVAPNRDQHVWRLESETERGGQTLTDAVLGALGAKPEIGLVVVTGDLTFTGQPDEFSEAKMSLRRLLRTLELDSSRLVVVPGNHDIQWTTGTKYDEKAEVKLAPKSAKANYKDFYREMFRHDADDTLAMARRFVMPSGGVLDICGLNSSSLETRKNFLAGMGRIEESALHAGARVLGWTGPDSMALRFVALHHHLSLVEDIDEPKEYKKGFGIAIDAGKIQRLATRRGVHLALHGHKHRVAVWGSTVYELPEKTQKQWRLGNLALIGSGSTGSEDTDGRRNFFNLIEVNPSGVELKIYRAEKPRSGGAFEHMKTWKAPITAPEDRAGISLGKWTVAK